MTTIYVALMALLLLSLFNLFLTIILSNKTHEEVESLGLKNRKSELEIKNKNNNLDDLIVSLNLKLEEKASQFEKRIEVIENPAKFKLGDSLYKINSGQFMGTVIDVTFCGSRWNYTVLIDGKKMKIDPIYQESFTNFKPKSKSKK